MTSSGDVRMDDRDVLPWVGAVALGVMLAALAALAWLLQPLFQGPSGGQTSSYPLSTHHRLLDPMRRCIDATATRGVPGCANPSFAPTAPSTPSQRRVQRSTRAASGRGTPPQTRVSTSSAPASRPPATSPPVAPSPTQPPATQPTPQPPPASTPSPSPHDGPVPGGNTAQPHTGPRP